MFRLLRILVVASCAAVLLGPAEAASDTLSVKLRGRAAGLVAGQPWQATVEVRRDGKPVAGAAVAVVVRDTSGATRSFRARTAGRGLYRARVVFPWAARWAVTARVAGRTFMLARANVRPKPRGPEPVTLANPAELAVLADGTLLVVENGLGRLVRVDPESGRVTPWQALEDSYGLALGSDGAVFATSGNDIVRIDGSGNRSQVARFDTAIGPLELGPDGFLYVATAQQQILRVNPATGASSVYAGNGTAGAAGDGGPATSAQIQGVHGMAFWAGGALYLADTGNDRVRRIDATTRVITTVATIRIAVAAATAADGSVYVTSGGNRVFRIAPDGSVGVFAGNGRASSAGDGGPATAASLHGPVHLATDGAGTVYVTEIETGRIRRIDTAGRISTIVRRA